MELKEINNILNSSQIDIDCTGNVSSTMARKLITALRQVKNIAYEPVLADSVCKHEWTTLDRGRVSCVKCEMIQSRI